MPRPRVRSEDRQRSAKACSACKASKIRCDSESPCSSCIKRGRGASCQYAQVDRRRRLRVPRLDQDTSLYDGDTTATYTGGVLTTPPRDSETSIASPAEVLSAPIVTPPPSGYVNSAQSRPSLRRGPSIDNPVDEQVPGSETESLSFLYFLRKTLRPFLGNIPFTDGGSQNVMHDEEEEEEGTSKETQDVSVEQMYSLLDSYFEATSGLLDLFTADEVDSLIAERARLPSSNQGQAIRREDLAALDVALAIGAQTQPHVRRIGDPRAHLGFFRRASRIAFERMLVSPSVPMVRLFLLMAFYMLGTCRRHAASMYLGIASKAADVLGLQNIQPIAGSLSDDHLARARVANSLTVINVLASFILGRHQNMPLANVETVTSRTAKGPVAEHEHSTFSAILQGCTHIETIVQSLRTGNMLDLPTAECLLEQLRHWTASLREPIRQFSFSQTAELDSADRQALIGHVHLSCVYYFAVILISRPFLIVYLISRLRGRAPDYLIDDPNEAADTTIKNNEISKLAQVCVSSAIFMIKSLQKVQASRFSFGNLSLLKAWVFGSGLVLGFSMFAADPREDIQEAFEGARDVLSSIAEISPQARLYHTILSDFAEAVGKYRQRTQLEIRKTVQHYLDPMPFLKVTQGEFNHNTSPSFSETMMAMLQNSTQGLGGDQHDDYLAMDLDLQIDWADLDLMLIDSSLMATQPFEGLFCSVE